MPAPVSPQQKRALQMAAQWFATLCAGEISPQQSSKWQQWYQQHADHRWAWQQVESLQGQLQQMPGHLSYQALHQSQHEVQQTRRRVLKTLLLLLGTGGGSWQLWRSPYGIDLRADYHTATGEHRQVQLEEGSLLQLSTASAVQIDFTAQQRRVSLSRGEIAITTAADAAQRPFLVTTAEGSLRALGTEFSVRQWPGATTLSVQRHAVEVTLHSQPGETRRVAQGQQLRFTARQFAAIEPLDAGALNWTRGLLSVSNRRLDEVIAEVARWRQGMLLCDASAAGLRVSGTFPLADTDALLRVLAQSLPVKIQTLSRYWVKVSAA